MNNSRGVSPMGGMTMSAPILQQPPPQQSMNPNAARHGSVGGIGMNMNGPKPGSTFDPFDNLTGLNAPRPMGGQQYGQQPQQNNFNSMNRNNNAMNQNNRGRGF